MKNTLGNYSYQEIISQGDIWKKTLECATSQIPPTRKWLEDCQDEIIFIGCGSTYYLSLVAANLWTRLTHKPARGFPSSELWYYPATILSDRTPLLVAISRSGETTETIQAIKLFKEKFTQDCLVISCYPESSMVKNSKLALLAPHAHEESVIQTRSFSSMLILTQILAASAAKNAAFIEHLTMLPEVFPKLIEKYESLAKRIAFNQKYNHFVFLGSGLNYGLASEIMLKMKEMSLSVSEVFHFMEFRHGPMSMISDQSLVIGLMSETAKDQEMKVLRDMKALGADTLALTEHSSGLDVDFVVEFNAGIPQEALGVLYLPILQLMSYYHAISKGINPDQPKNLSAVVRL
ncbi:MAG: SIS domain-containing protein [Anaerolineales bacterium]|nr:SIS domain-containing protein [Anaerolineales bacterium]